MPPIAFSLREKAADKVGRMRERAERGGAPNPHPQPLSRRSGESCSCRRETGAGAPLPFSLGEKVASIGRSEERPFFRTPYGAG